jgi:hypothetical protein
MKTFATRLALTACLWAGTASAATHIAGEMRYVTPLANGQCMIAATTNKTAAGTMVIPFGMNFSVQPVVTLTPFWRGSGQQVGAIDTVTALSVDQFSVTSGNAAANYFVNWTAIGPAPAATCK